MKINIPEHLRSRFSYLNELAFSKELPAPWNQSQQIAIGGLTEVGFANSSDLLLCISSGGRGLIDCVSGERVARDDAEGFQFDSGNLLATGIGPLSGELVRVAGLAGGGLASGTNDGWGVERHPFAYPSEQLFVSPPTQTMLWNRESETPNITKLGGFVTELRAYGFSPTGRSLVIATSSDIMIFARD